MFGYKDKIEVLSMEEHAMHFCSVRDTSFTFVPKIEGW
jgi:hypothetical protein